MKNLNIVTSKLLVTIFCLLIINLKPASAAQPTTAECQAALSIVTTSTSMDFGSYVGGTTGTITMPPVIGNPMVYSNVIGVPASAAIPSTFELTTTLPQCGNGNLMVPNSITVTNGGSPITITITNADIDPPATNFKVSKKPYILTIGGTLQAVASSATGIYTGPLDITFTYP